MSASADTENTTVSLADSSRVSNESSICNDSYDGASLLQVQEQVLHTDSNSLDNDNGEVEATEIVEAGQQHTSSMYEVCLP